MTGGDSALPIWADFMTAALQAHPEWAGDWQMPSGIEQVEIDTTTGLLATPESTSKRVELFINGTAPQRAGDDALTDESTPTDEGTEEGAGDPEAEASPDGRIEVPPLPEASPPSRPRGAPGLEGRGEDDPAGPTRLSGTVTLDIDPTTGLIAADTCPVIRTRAFAIGTEPRRRCGPQYHTNQSIVPAETRPRRASPPRDN
jgi:hypothetical protein